MANSLYITSTEARSGKSAISLGVMETLLWKNISAPITRRWGSWMVLSLLQGLVRIHQRSVTDAVAD